MGSQCGSACIICIFPWQERKKKKKRVIIYIFGPSLYLLLRSGKNCDEWKTKSFSASLFSAIFSVFVLPVRSSLPKQRVTFWKLIWNVSWALSECRSHNIKLKVVVDNISLLYCDPLSMRGGRPSPRFEPIHTGSDVVWISCQFINGYQFKHLFHTKVMWQTCHSIPLLWYRLWFTVSQTRAI